MVMGRFLSKYRVLEKKIGYSFRKKALIEMALTHRSYRFENPEVTDDNQRLEFLGDAVLGFATAAYAYEKFQSHDEGPLTAFRSQVTSGKALAKLAVEVGVNEFIRIGKGEGKSGGANRPTNLADALESLLGAAYLDGGLKAVNRIFEKIFVPIIDSLDGDVWAENPKGKLQETSQRLWKVGPVYKLLKREGPPHAAEFTVEVVLGDGSSHVGVGANKRDAEIVAALSALKSIAALSQPE